jgi:hypothetical protein
MSNRRPLALLLATVALATVACGGTPGSTAQPPASPDSSPGASPALGEGAIQHPTGATDIVLRYEEVGGMMIPEFGLAQVPVFTLYGDGTVVFVPAGAEPGFEPGKPIVRTPLRTAKLSPEQMQDLLEVALRDGGLAAARLRYEDMFVSDASTAVFTINAGGAEKVVSAYALGFENPQAGPDTAILTAMTGLRDRLADFDQGGTFTSEPYAPQAYRGILLDAAMMADVPVMAWPWEGLTLADFAGPLDPNSLQTLTRALSPEEVAALGIEGIEGGAHGIYVRTDDGKLFSLVVRPLLPDEEAIPPAAG